MNENNSPSTPPPPLPIHLKSKIKVSKPRRNLDSICNFKFKEKNFLESFSIVKDFKGHKTIQFNREQCLFSIDFLNLKTIVKRLKDEPLLSKLVFAGISIDNQQSQPKQINSNFIVQFDNEKSNFIEILKEKDNVLLLRVELKKMFGDFNSSTTAGHVFIVDTAPDDIPANINNTGLFIGSQDAARNVDFLLKNEILFILNVGFDAVTNTVDKINTLHIPLLDESQTELSSHFQMAFDFIDRGVIEKKKHVLIHCNAGVSRSVSIAIAWLLYKRICTEFEEALQLIRKTRAAARPNDGFRSQLLQYASELNNR